MKKHDTIDLDAVKVLDHLVQRAVSIKASDIHLEPRRKSLNVRFRIDGVMSDQGTLPLDLAPSLLTRVKVLARMDMTVRRLPQDGQFSLELGDGHLVHLRASTFPAIHGENLVMRVLLGHELIAIEDLGMDQHELDGIRKLTKLTSGLIVVCGPTGSGKTSTLYSIIRELDTANQSVVTLEDPIEVEFSDVTQGQTNPRAGFTFESGLRAILRQDPDVIMVGEMRDPQTASIALQASLTGHLVLTTLHTSNTVESITRLIDLGVEPWIVGNSLAALVAQRLVRTLCHCARQSESIADVLLSADEPRVLLPKGSVVKEAVGCDACHDSGYHGRTAIFEMLNVTDDLRDLIKSQASTRRYREQVQKIGSRSLREAGITRVVEGLTTLEEVLRVT